MGVDTERGDKRRERTEKGVGLGERGTVYMYIYIISVWHNGNVHILSYKNGLVWCPWSYDNHAGIPEVHRIL